jgi:hypothetical protein
MFTFKFDAGSVGDLKQMLLKGSSNILGDKSSSTINLHHHIVEDETNEKIQKSFGLGVSPKNPSKFFKFRHTNFDYAKECIR